MNNPTTTLIFWLPSSTFLLHESSCCSCGKRLFFSAKISSEVRERRDETTTTTKSYFSIGKVLKFHDYIECTTVVCDVCDRLKEKILALELPCPTIFYDITPEKSRFLLLHALLVPCTSRQLPSQITFNVFECVCWEYRVHYGWEMWSVFFSAHEFCLSEKNFFTLSNRTSICV